MSILLLSRSKLISADTDVHGFVSGEFFCIFRLDLVCEVAVRFDWSGVIFTMEPSNNDSCLLSLEYNDVAFRS